MIRYIKTQILSMKLQLIIIDAQYTFGQEFEKH